MRNKERNIWISLLVVILAVLIVSIYQYHKQLSNLEQRNASLISGNIILKQRNEDYTTATNGDCATKVVDLMSEVRKRDEIIKNMPNYVEETMDSLQREGFTINLKDIVADLQKHTELIPYKGVLGGTMGFEGDNAIHILTRKK